MFGSSKKLFSIKSNLNSYKTKKSSSFIEEIKLTNNLNDLLRNAFNYCLIGRWFVFDFKSTSTYQETIVRIRVPRIEVDEFISIYKYLKNNLDNDLSLDFSNSLESIIDSTFNESLGHEGSDDSICGAVKILKLNQSGSDDKKILTATSTPTLKKKMLKEIFDF